jgi:hypothetical protein
MKTPIYLSKTFSSNGSGPNFPNSKLAVLIEDSSTIDPNLTFLKEKRDIMTAMQQASNFQRAQSVKAYSKRLKTQQKQEESMKNVRIISKKPKVDKEKLIQDVAMRLILCPSGDFSEVQCYWTRLDSEGWIPESREGAGLCFANRRLYLVGGLSRTILSQVAEFSTDSRSWLKLETQIYKLEPVYGHSLVQYGSQLLIFGGTTEYNEITRKRECLHMVRILSLASKKISYVPTHGVIYEFRKYHTAVVYNKHMLVYGGLNPKNLVLDSCIVLNLQTLRWRALDTIGSRPPPLAGHAACAVYFPETSPSLFHKPKKIREITQQGVYIFAGYDQNCKATNSLYVLKPGHRPLTWLSPATTGQSPCPRYYHSMNWVEYANSLVVFGGRNDEIGACYADVHVLRLKQLVWIRTNVAGSVPGPRSAHAVAYSEKKVYVFGGVCYGKFVPSEVFELRFDFPEMYREKRPVLPYIKG